MRNTINIRISTPMEFMNSLFALGTDKGFIEMIRAFDLEPNDEITGMLQKMGKTLSHYIQQELTYFFDASGLGFIFYKYIIHNPTLSKVTDVVEKIQQDTADEFVFRIIESVCKNTLPAKGSQAYKALLGNKSGLLELLGVTKVQDEHRRVRVVEALENPEEIKQRFTLLLSRFYAVSFAPFEADIIQCIETEQPRYEVMLAETPELFIRQFMNLDDLKDHSAGYIIH